MFAYQGHHIVHNLGPVFRVFVPLVLYFAIMWTTAFWLVWACARRARGAGRGAGSGPREGGGPAASGAGGGEGDDDGALWTYEMAVVQSFTAASNNFVSGVGGRFFFASLRAFELARLTGR